MANLSDFNSKVDAIQTAVDDIVAEIQNLRDTVSKSGMTGDDEDAALTRLGDIEAKLNAIKQPQTPGGTEPGTPPVEPPPAP